MCQVGLLVLNWNDYEATIEFVQSTKYIYLNNIKIFIIDNGSDDGSPSKFIHKFGDSENIELVLLDKNHGFAGGMNRGILEALSNGCEFVFILNNDIVFDAGVNIEQLMDKASDEDVGLVTPTIYEYPNKDDVWFNRGKFTESSLETIHEEEVASGRFAINDYAPFCAAMVSRDTLLSNGILDERYFMYFEDVDYCTRLRQNGLDIITDTESRVYHKVSQSTGGRFTKSFTYYRVRNAVLFGRKLGKGSCLFFLIWAVKAFIDRLIHRSPFAALVVPIALVHGLIGKTGKTS